MKPRHAGFTLIELLVVAMVIGISLSLIVVRLSKGERDILESEAQRLSLLLRHAADAAVSAGRPLAWNAVAGGYTFACKSRGEWLVCDDDPLLKPYQWPASVRLGNIRIAGVMADPAEPLLFYPEGWNAPFELELAAGDLRVTVAAAGAGRAHSVPSLQP